MTNCACDWPGCRGQCHTGDSCPCHPADPLRPIDTDTQLDLTDTAKHAIGLYLVAGLLAVFLVGVVAVVIGGQE